MNYKMIEILKLLGFKQDEEERWIKEFPETGVNDAGKHYAYEVEDGWTGNPSILINDVYDDDFLVDDSEGVDLATFILLNFE